MKIACLKEIKPNEKRVAISPDTVKRFIKSDFEIIIETDAGKNASITDDAYKSVGATIAADAKETLKNADIVLKVQSPTKEELVNFKKGSVLICAMNALTDKETLKMCADAGITIFAMELMPRTTKAQMMDILSSQANLAGYRAVIDACYEFNHAIPMLMTAAGTIPAARVCIMGAGVAGLQAIATARRLGAIVSAFDVRPAVREEVKSLGATFVSVDEEGEKDAQTSGGYAKEMSEEYKKKQAQVVAEHLKKQDIVICTAQIPGRKAPVLVSEEVVKTMKPGSIIVDLAVESGGNCPLSEVGKVVEKYGVKIIGHYNVPSRLAADTSALYAKNLYNFALELYDKEKKVLNINMANELIAGTLVAKDGAIVEK
ncbi:MAG TPA: Re/Si-specific NAD(P)(+) transhydrogenase subunit alpha [Elusimicrobiales bacterium]|nr:Re/Si-specific NAD(P)(+) transhydrogenase subunit alpha [Elusimicrobiales bacterium]